MKKKINKCIDILTDQSINVHAPFYSTALKGLKGGNNENFKVDDLHNLLSDVFNHQVWLTFSTLAIKYKCALAGQAGAHFTGYYNNH